MTEQATELPTRPEPIYYGKPEQHGAFVYGMEKIADMLDEVRHTYAHHYAETEITYKDHDIDGDWERLIKTEKAAQFVIFTARDLELNLIGYLCYYVGKSMHVKGVLHANEAGFFIEKKYRRESAGQNLLEYCERELSNLGVSYATMTSKHPVGGSDLSGFMERNNYRKISIEYQKRLPNTPTTH